MAAAKTNIKLDYGNDWEFIGLFPLNLTGVSVEVEIVEKANDMSTPRNIYCYATSLSVTKDANIVITQTNPSPIEYSVSFTIDSHILIRKVGAGNFHWRMYFNFPSGLRELALGGKFSYKETV